MQRRRDRGKETDRRDRRPKVEREMDVDVERGKGACWTFLRSKGLQWDISRRTKNV
jgi:hypothetical protein